MDDTGSCRGPTVGRRFEDDRGVAQYVEIKTGWIRGAVHAVPAHELSSDGDDLRAPYTRDHLEGAPTVLSMLAYAPQAQRLGRTVRVATGGAPPSPAILRRMGELGFDVTHLYGLTETFGPAMICDWRPEWDGLDADGQAVRRPVQR